MPTISVTLPPEFNFVSLKFHSYRGWVAQVSHDHTLESTGVLRTITSEGIGTSPQDAVDQAIALWEPKMQAEVASFEANRPVIQTPPKLKLDLSSLMRSADD